MAGLTANAREAVRANAASQIRGELALDVSREPVHVEVGITELGDQRLRMTCDQFVQDRSLGRGAGIR